jgi:FkbM family methyltransferase
MLLKYYQKLDDAISYLSSSFCNEKKLLKSILKKKKILYIDVGLNHGSYLDYLSSFMDLKCAYVFEPIPELCKKIKNNYRNSKIQIFNLALSNKREKKMFYQYNISSQSSLYEQNNTFRSLKKLNKKYKVQTDKFDNIFNKFKTIDFCKIDVQGEDLNVLKGMKLNLLKKNIKLIKIEILFTNIYKNVEPNFYHILDYMRKNEYFLISISKIKFKNNKILFMDAFFEPAK